MPDERQRQQLYQELGGLLTKASVDELMSYLPPVGGADVATKADLGVLHSDMDALRAELKGDMAELKGDMAKLEGRFDKLEGRFQGLEGRFQGLFQGLEGRFEGLEGRFEGHAGEVAAKSTEAKQATQAWGISTLLALVLGLGGVAIAILLVKP